VRGEGVVRVRVGVGREGVGESGGLAAYVLGQFTRGEMVLLEGEVYGKVKRAVEGIAAGELERMMNLFNGKQNRNGTNKTDGHNARKAEERQALTDTGSKRAAVT